MFQFFERSQEFLNLEIEQADPILEQKEKVQYVMENATPDELGAMLKALGELDASKIHQANA